VKAPLNHSPVGTIIPYAGPVVDAAQGDPAFPKPGLAAYERHLKQCGWLLCDGRSVAVAVFPELFRVIGYIYGKKSSGFFFLPDLRGRFLRGVNSGAKEPDGFLRDPDQAARAFSATGGWKGDAVGSVQSDALRKHWHYYDKAATAALSSKGSNVFSTFEHVPTDPSSDLKGKPGERLEYAARETRPRNLYVHFLIKFTPRGGLGIMKEIFNCCRRYPWDPQSNL